MVRLSAVLREMNTGELVVPILTSNAVSPNGDNLLRFSSTTPCITVFSSAGNMLQRTYTLLAAFIYSNHHLLLFTKDTNTAGWCLQSSELVFVRLLDQISYELSTILIYSRPRWCSAKRVCQWTQGSLVETRERAIKILTTPSIEGEVKPSVSCKILRYVKYPFQE
jgi:hypothetical protein